jgi:hypothetical protein
MEKLAKGFLALWHFPACQHKKVQGRCPCLPFTYQTNDWVEKIIYKLWIYLVLSLLKQILYRWLDRWEEPTSKKLKFCTNPKVPVWYCKQSRTKYKKQHVGKSLAKTTLQRRLFSHLAVEETLRQRRSRTAWSRRERQKDSLRTGTSKSCGFPICGLDEVHPYPYLPEPGGGLVEIHEESQLVAQRTIKSCQTLKLGVRVDTKIYS